MTSAQTTLAGRVPAARSGAEIAHPSLADRRAEGQDASGRVPLSSHADWHPAADRPDPVALLEGQNTTREPDLVPVRHGRMMVSPFTFYRGAAKIMAADLGSTGSSASRRSSSRPATWLLRSACPRTKSCR
jgi:hypothetical protein